MLISIIIPNYNKGLYIAETLNCLLRQTYHNWEAIIVDDGSTDNSIEIINTFTAQDQRFKLIKRKKEQKGGSSCRNIGLEQANGEYSIFLDSDDLLINTCLKNRVSTIKHHPHNDFWIFSGGTFYTRVGDSPSKWIPPQGKHLNMFLSHTLPWHTTSPIWKTHFLLKLKGFNINYPRLQDVELHTRALLQQNVKYKVVVGDKPDFYYRIDENRNIKEPYDFAATFISAVKLYNHNMLDFIKTRPDNVKLNKSLNGTYIAAYLSTQVQYDFGKLKMMERNALFAKIMAFHEPKGIFKIYISGLQMGLHKIKGYNWVFKKILTR
ncbi:glycosyltransferase family 2 protein [Flammeovirga pacifica]|nr:glycosyltransferase family 2 protein [Flammeovirga pacifica]